VIGVVDQLSVAQWISLLWVRIITGAVGAAYMVFIVFLDPKTSTLFPFTGRRRDRDPAPVRPRTPGSTRDVVPRSAPTPSAGPRRGGAPENSQET
jgi:hypothetical protein